MTRPRLLTKSRFKTGLSCPTKLFYTKKSEEWANNSINDPFLIELAKGGYQVGELAKCYFPNGIEVEEYDYDISWEKTKELLKRENVIIFEAAIRFKNLFVRVDVLKKTGNKIELIEVKSKSLNSSTFTEEVWDKRKLAKNCYSLKSTWEPYILDIAFQTYVFKNAFPKFSTLSYLLCPDKSKKSSIDGLNQKFQVKEISPSNYEVKIKGDVTVESLGNKILEKVDISDIVEIILGDKLEAFETTQRNFTNSIDYLSNAYLHDTFIDPTVGSKCKNCEFRSNQENLKNGFENCWNSKGITNIKQSFVFDIWNFRGSEKLISQNIFQIGQLEKDNIVKKQNPNQLKMDTSTRQWLQIEKELKSDPSPTYYFDGLISEMMNWKYPLHMIDFETSRVAIPFLKNKRPYEQITFQFSHHVIRENGEIEHFGQFLETTPGSYPNFNFVRCLKSQLEADDGSIFMYHHHEQNVLCEIKEQLETSSEPDKDVLIDFIKSITTKKRGKDVLWKGQRSMIDLCEMVKRYYYNPETKNSNSIKAVLPAILNESEFLKEKYSSEIYGKGKEINSINFDSVKWVQLNNGKVQDPYKLLDTKILNWNYAQLEEYMSDPTINNGGAAMVAYAILQFFDIPDEVRKHLEESLLRYCELDTLAMVFIWEHWNNLQKEVIKEESA